MDKCPKCGNKLSSIDVLCPKCGALVEVVQIKKGTAGQNASSDMSIPVKKQPQQNLIVYNDDWPVDDTDMLSSLDAAPEVKPDDIPAPYPDDVSELLKHLDTPAIPETKPSMETPFSPESELESEENYLAMFRNMKLPELEDINTENTAEPSYSEQLTAADPPEPSIQPEPRHAESIPVTAGHEKHRWLEIEELSDNPPVDAPISTSAEPTDTETEAPEAPVPASDEPGESRFRYRSERRQATTVLHPRRNVGRVVMMIFVWLLVTGALFCGFFFLDQYVTEHYGSYPAMLYEWSNGAIDLDPSAELSPTPIEAPAP